VPGQHRRGGRRVAYGDGRRPGPHLDRVPRRVAGPAHHAHHQAGGWSGQAAPLPTPDAAEDLVKERRERRRAGRAPPTTAADGLLRRRTAPPNPPPERPWTGRAACPELDHEPADDGLGRGDPEQTCASMAASSPSTPVSSPSTCLPGRAVRRAKPNRPGRGSLRAGGGRSGLDGRCERGCVPRLAAITPMEAAARPRRAKHLTMLYPREHGGPQQGPRRQVNRQPLAEQDRRRLCSFRGSTRRRRGRRP
jgi:hypothetical protein